MSSSFSNENQCHRQGYDATSDLFHSTKLGAGFLFLLAILVYLPSLHGGFVWDDESSIIQNHLLRNMDGLREIWAHPSLNTEPHYWPITYTSFWVDYQIWGLRAFGYHLTNVLLHAFNGILLWMILRKIEIPGAWFAAAIFAVHPVHVESVAWIIERKDVLSGLFYLLAFRFFLNYDKDNNWKEYLLSIFFFLCAIWSKSITVTLPLVMVLWFWWKKASLTVRDLVPVFPFFILAFICSFLDYRLTETHASFHTNLTLIQRVLIAGRVFWFSVGKLIYPINLMTYYPQWKISISSFTQYIYPCMMIVILAVFFFLRKVVGKGCFVATCFFAITLSPHLGFVDYGFMAYSYVADRFQYLAGIGLIVLFAVIVMKGILYIVGSKKEVLYGVMIIPLLILSLLTWSQAGIYKNMETLIRYNLQKNPNAWSTHYNWAVVLARKGNISDAIKHYNEAIELNPNYADAHNNLAMLLVQQGKLAEAMNQYTEAIQINPQLATAHNNMAILLLQEGKTDDAMAHYKIAIEINPLFAEAYNNVGLVLAKQGKLNEAIEYFSKALEINPEYREAKQNLEVVRAMQKALLQNGTKTN
jgi:protein O-mannosyl-transferase